MFSILSKKRCQAVHMAIKNTHLKTRDNNGISAQLQNNSKSDTPKTTTTTYTLRLINPQFKPTADHVYAEANQIVQHACRNKSQSFQI